MEAGEYPQTATHCTFGLPISTVDTDRSRVSVFMPL